MEDGCFCNVAFGVAFGFPGGEALDGLDFLCVAVEVLSLS